MQIGIFSEERTKELIAQVLEKWETYEDLLHHHIGDHHRFSMTALFCFEVATCACQGDSNTEYVACRLLMAINGSKSEEV